MKTVMFRRAAQGFALPTIVITSVVLFAVLVAVMSTVSSVRATLNSQYQQALARDAAESGVAYAEYCYTTYASTASSSQWPKATSGAGLTLDTGDDCYGFPKSGVNCNSATPSNECFVVINGNIKSRFSVPKPVVNGINYQLTASSSAGAYRPGFVMTTGQSYSASLRFSGYIQIDGLATGNDTSCAIQLSKLYCWGKNTSGQVGIGTAGSNVLTPVLVQGALTGKYVYDVATGIEHTCAVAGNSPAPDTTSRTYCWGDNSLYQYGIGNNTTVSYVPMQVATISGYYPVAISARDHTCVIAVSNSSSTTRKAYCWGDNTWGQAGESGAATATPTQYDPKPNPGSPVRFRASPYNDLTNITAISSVHSATLCGIDAAKVFCIGSNGHGQLGDGLTPNNARVKYVINTSNADLTGVTKIVTNNGSVCTISASKVYCWGSNGDKSIPKLDWRLDSGPNFAAAVATTKATALITTGSHFSKTITDVAISDWNTCFIASGEVYCSGYNDMGQLGQGNTSGPVRGAATAASQVVSANNAVKVGGALAGKVVTRIAGGNDHFCAITNESDAYCWGDNTYGQLGDGSSTIRTLPSKVKIPPPTIF